MGGTGCVIDALYGSPEAEGNNNKKLFELDTHLFKLGTMSFEQVTKSFKHDNSKNLFFFALGFSSGLSYHSGSSSCFAFSPFHHHLSFTYLKVDLA